MSAFEDMFGTNRVWETIMRSSNLRTQRLPRSIIFNCPMCVTRGHRPDTRKRGGMENTINGVGISCLNCGFVTKYQMGSPLGRNVKEFLTQIGVSSTEIAYLNYWALTLQKIANNSNNPEIQTLLPNVPIFDAIKPLPDGEEWANDNCSDLDFLRVIEYLYDRGEEIAESYTYYWAPSKIRNLNERIIIPCYNNDKMVGWTSRAITSKIFPKYYNQTPQNLLFNSSALNHSKRNNVIIVEGIFDAIAIDGVALLGAKLNENQALWINNSGKQIICVPDRDKTGKALIDFALKYDWGVSMPRPISLGADRGWWSNEIKDAADAVKTYGRLYTIRSIIESTTYNKMKINLLRKNFEAKN
jgi:hypothetical protein